MSFSLARMGPSEREKLVERFWSQIQKSSSCWLWQGALQTNGYGTIWVGRAHSSRVGVHRLAYELARGAIPPKLLVLHRCDVKNCVRPSHLRIGTHQANTTDAQEKGRLASGERNGGAKLTWAQVNRIRELHDRGAQLEWLHLDFRVSRAAIRRIIQRESWISKGDASND